MFGTRIEEHTVPGYTSAYTGIVHPEKYTPAGYSGILRGMIFREMQLYEVSTDLLEVACR
jgi:hypothetical protein